MKSLTAFLIVLFLVTLTACKSGNYKESGYAADSAKVALDSISTSLSSSAAVVSKKESERKFVRTADLKFKVKSVVKSSYDIEDIVSRQGGFVTLTNLASTVDNVSTTQVSEDSILETTFYTISNTITIRVPNAKLDTTLKEISRNIDYLDYRIIKADDVALQLLSNEFIQKRAIKNEARLTNAIDTKGKKLIETSTTEELLLNKQEAADNAKIANLSLLDQVNFSTININIYQRQTLKRELIGNGKRTKEYEPNFALKIVASLSFGWDILSSTIIFLVKLWAFFLLGIIAYYTFKTFGKRSKK